MDFTKIWDWLHSRDLYTWIGHGILGFVLTVVFGPAFTLGAFVYREVSDLLSWWADDRARWWGPLPYPLDSQDYKRPFAAKLKDGFFDLWAPLAGAAIALLIFG